MENLISRWWQRRAAARFESTFKWPGDFPEGAHERLNSLVAPLQPRHPDLYQEYAGGWNGLRYRFASATESAEGFARALVRAGNSPRMAERYIQERDLFAFFVNSLATLESAAYAARAVGAMVDPVGLPLTSDGHKRAATLKDTRDKHFASFPTEPLTITLAALTASVEFQELERIRNVLAHRAAPSRRFYRGGDRDGEADWLAFGISLDADTIATRRRWLSDALGLLLDTAAEFADSHL